MSKKIITFFDSSKQQHDFPIITPDYGTCSTASNTSAKVVTCDDFSLFTGAEITVKFTNVPTTDTITLNVNNSGAKNVDFSACGNKPYDEIKANGCYGFVYDGTSWIYKGSGKGASKEELERLKYYGDKDIIPSDESYFTVNETGETITGLTDTGKTQTELVIPYKINGVKITNLYSGNNGTSILNGATDIITKVVIPNSITSIEDSAFAECISLKSINIPNNVISIGEGAFTSCISLTSINIPDSVTSISALTFQFCLSLKSITIPNSVTSIGEGAFKNCTSLTSITIPNNVTSIEHSAFYAYDDNIGSYVPIPGLTIYCEQGSYAETYAKTNNIPVVYTDVKATSINPTVKTALEDTITVNTIYDLGVQTELTITLPSGQIGDFIQFDFISGSTATDLLVTPPTTLTVNSSSGLVGFDLIPGTNTIYTLYFDWGETGLDGTDVTYGWRFNYSEYSIDVA